MRRAARRGVAAMGAALLALSGCAESGGPAPTPSPTLDASLVGEVLTNDDPAGLSYQPLPDGEPRSMSLPDDVQFTPSAVPAGDGAIALVFGEFGGRLYRVEPGEAPRRILRDVGDPTGLAAAPGGIVVGDCRRRVLVLTDLDGGRRRDVGGGCVGAVSPDGTEVAYTSRDAVSRAAADGSGAPVRLFALSDVPGLDDALTELRPSVFAMTWGEPGLALAMGNEESAAVVVARPNGALSVIPTLGSNTLVTFLRWQPDGRLLGIATGQTGSEGFLRLYDPDEERLRTIGLHSRGFVSAVWAPDGESILAVSGAGFFGSGGGHWVHVDLEGRQLGRVLANGALLYDWRP